MGSITCALSNQRSQSDGSLQRVDAPVVFGTSYNNTGSDATTGETLSASTFGLSRIFSVVFDQNAAAGYGFGILGDTVGGAASVRVKVFASAGGAGVTGSTSGGTPAGTNAASATTAQVFTGTASRLNIASPSFSGVGLTAAGQVMTTTDNKTMTLNQCAGMWLISATGATPPNLIISNTAVVAAQAVLTVAGSVSTDAGAYQIVSVIPVGTNAAGTAAAQVFAGNALAGHTHVIAAGGSGEVANATNLNAAGLTAVNVIVYGV